MKTIGSISLIILFFFMNTFPGSSLAVHKALEPDRTGKARIVDNYGKLPLSFEENQGQSNEKVRFLSRGGGYTLFLTADEAVLALSPPSEDEGSGGRKRDALQVARHVKQKKTKGAVIRMKFSGANAAPMISGEESLPGISNYLIGNDPSKWRSRIPKYTKVRYSAIYPGIDLVFYGNQRRLEYDFVVSPGSDLSKVKLEFQGLKELRLDENGSLVLRLKAGEVIQRAPVIYQEVDGKRVDVAGGYWVDHKGRVGFKVASWDRQRPLVIDPVLVYSTYLGGNGFDAGYGIAVDGSGNAYVTGRTASSDFPTVNALYPNLWGNSDAFIFKLNADGNQVIYSTYLGGNSLDYGNGIAVDGSGNAYVTGWTESSDFPTVNALYPNLWGNSDAFIFKLSADGSQVIYSTYLGGNDSEEGIDIAVDGSENTYVTGSTHSSDFPTVNALYPNLWGNVDAFIFKLSADGSHAVYSTYLGGNDFEVGHGIAADSFGNSYVTGSTYSSDFPTVNALYPNLWGNYDAFIFKLSADGSHAVYSTYLGGSEGEEGKDVVVDGSGNIYVTGVTRSSDFPTVNALYPNLSGDHDAFIFKLSADGGQVIYSTYLGGNDAEFGYGIALDGSGNTYVTGATYSSDFPTVNALYQDLLGLKDAFIFKLSADGSHAVYSTYLGGNDFEVTHGIAVDSFGNAYVTGATSSSDFPTVNAMYSNLWGISDAFIVKISENPAVDPTIAQTPMSGPPGTTFTQWGTDFTPNSTGKLHVRKPDGTEYPVQDQEMDGIGHFEIQYTAPGDKPPGTYTWWVFDGPTGIKSNEVAYVVVGVLGQLHHFRFSEIGNQNIDTEFAVTITAEDFAGTKITSFNGGVSLWSNAGNYTLTPISIRLESGQWIGNVKLNEAGNGIRIECGVSGISGESNLFDVSGASSNIGYLGGQITDGEGNLLPREIRVSLSGFLKYTDNGAYQYDSSDNIQCGSHILSAQDVLSGKTSDDYLVTVPCDDRSVTQDIKICFCDEQDDKVPILLVNGILGSADINDFDLYPNFRKLSYKWDDKQLKLFAPGTVGWKKLKKELINDQNRYKEGCNLFEVPYDWRWDLSQNVTKFLEPWISRAKEISGKPKVNIIAHSMGGLLTRKYIQDVMNESDVDVFRLAMVGTPNMGSSNAYYMWEGGNPKLVDNILAWGEPIIPTLYFYWNTTLENYVEMDPGASFLLPFQTNKIWKFYTGGTPEGDTAKNALMGLKQLLPTYPFLGHDTPKSLEKVKNNFLDDLNNNSNKYRMGIKGSGKVETVVFYSESESTIKTIKVGTATDPLYKDGQPLGKTKSAEFGSGDGTVLKDSAILPCEEEWADKHRIEGEHKALIKNSVSDLVGFINGDLIFNNGIFSSTKIQTALEADASENVFAITFKGRVQPYLVNPSGIGSGISPLTNLRENDIPNTVITLGPDSGNIEMNNITSGVYTLYLKNVYAEDYRLDFGLIEAASAESRKFHGFINAETLVFSLTVDLAADNKITMDHPPSSVDGLQADIFESGGLKTRLTWISSSDPDVVSYNIYAKETAEPYLSLLFSTTNTFYETAHPWAENSTITTMMYTVAAVKADGTKSFLSETVKNDDRDHDGLTDEEESLFGSYIDNPDSDSDGLNDSEEYIHGTNPLLADTDGDNYSDYIEVTKGSDPLDNNSVPTCPGDFDDHDGDIDGSDLAVFAADFGRTDCDSGPTCEGDFDGNDDVDDSDLATFVADFGKAVCP